jgi:hypothetical protein
MRAWAIAISLTALLHCAGALGEEKFEPGLLGEYYDMAPAEPDVFSHKAAGAAQNRH